MMYGGQAAFIFAGGYHHHTQRRYSSASKNGVGLYHTGFLYPTRKDLAIIYDRSGRACFPFTGAGDHGVTKALYLDDPDGNGIELYWHRPQELWPKISDGTFGHIYKTTWLAFRAVSTFRMLEVPVCLQESNST